MDIMD